MLSDEIATIHVCQGPPWCLVEGNDAIAAQETGCPWCRHITIYEDGSEREEGPKTQ